MKTSIRQAKLQPRPGNGDLVVGVKEIPRVVAREARVEDACSVFSNGLPALPRRDARHGDFGDETAVGGGGGKTGGALVHSQRLCLVDVAAANGAEDDGK